MGLISLRCGIGDQICVVKIYARADVIPFVIKQFLLALRRNKKSRDQEGRKSFTPNSSETRDAKRHRKSFEGI